MTLFEPILTLAELGPKWLSGVILSLFIFVSVLMVLVVLIQKPQGGGLSGAFGGSSAGSGQTAFGTKTGDALTLFTVGVFVVFVILAILLNLAMKPGKAIPGTTIESTGTTAPVETTPAENQTPAAPVDNTLGGALPTALPTAPVSPGAELPSPVTTPATPATTPATEPATPPAPKPDGGM
ncbi:hypothetical protein LBMAG48_20590 [Phycisphaerae bacterium]|nr:hypothetical protein LBMAG48_20590 [Phycisphaerae bacterium]